MKFLFESVAEGASPFPPRAAVVPVCNADHAAARLCGACTDREGSAAEGCNLSAYLRKYYKPYKSESLQMGGDLSMLNTTAEKRWLG